jgi:hypothetical protein
MELLLAIAKFFTPDAQWMWYVMEGSTRELGGCPYGKNRNDRSLREYNPERDDCPILRLRRVRLS